MPFGFGDFDSTLLGSRHLSFEKRRKDALMQVVPLATQQIQSIANEQPFGPQQAPQQAPQNTLGLESPRIAQQPRTLTDQQRNLTGGRLAQPISAQQRLDQNLTRFQVDPQTFLESLDAVRVLRPEIEEGADSGFLEREAIALSRIAAQQGVSPSQLVQSVQGNDPALVALQNTVGQELSRLTEEEFPGDVGALGRAAFGPEQLGREVGAVATTGVRIAAEEAIPGGGRPSLEAVREGGLQGAVERSIDVGVDIGPVRVGPADLLNPLNLIPIPILDPALARLLGIVGRAGSRITRAALQRLAGRAGEIAAEEGVEQATRDVARQFADDVAQQLAQDPTLASVARPEPAPAVREAVGGGTRLTPNEMAELSSLSQQENIIGIAENRRLSELRGRAARADQNTFGELRPVEPGAAQRAVPEVAQAPPVGPAATAAARQLPPIAGAATGRPVTPTGATLPEMGRAGIIDALNLKEETLLKPGVLTQLPGIKQAISGLNPSVTIDRQVLVSYNARQAVGATLETEFAASRRALVEAVENALDTAPPRYIGPKNTATNYLIDTSKHIFENPEFYADISPTLRAAITAYSNASDQVMSRFVGEYNGRIRPFSVDKPDWAYLPTVPSRETLDESLLKVTDGFTASGLSTRTGVAKSRVYETAHERSLKNPGFRAETDLAELTSLHDRAVASMAANETFKAGAGGRTRLDVMQELHPKLFERMIELRNKLASLRSSKAGLGERLTTAIDTFQTSGAESDALNDLLADLIVRPGDIAADATVIARDRNNIGRILSISDDGRTARVHFRNRQTGAEATKRMPTNQLTPLQEGVPIGTKLNVALRNIEGEIKDVRLAIHDLQPAWKAANLEPFVLNRRTFRYHEPETSAAVDRILLTKLPMGEGLLQAIDEVRLIAFTADISPLTIQGTLGILADPITGARSLPNAIRALGDPGSLIDIAAREVEEVRRYTMATGRPFGQVSSEFVQRARGIERVRGGRQLNDSLMAAVEVVRYKQWKTGTMLAQKLGGKSQNVADADAANILSKIIPALNPAERGASVLQARLERTPFISTSFIGGPATFVKDTASGLAKLTASRSLSPAARWQALAGREQLAILYASSMVGSIVTASITSHILSGWSPEDAVKEVLNPNGPRFISIALGPNRRIPIGGPLRSMAMAFIPQKAGEVGGVPVYVPFAGVPQWLKNKVTPAITAPIDLARNKDYFGGKIGTGSFPENMLRMIWYGVNQVLPLVGSEPSEAIRRGEVEPTDVGRIAELGGAQAAGVDLRETSTFEQFRHAFRAETGVDYDGRERHRTIAMQNPRLRELLEQSQREGVRRGTPFAVERGEREAAIADLAEDLRPAIEGVRAGNAEAGPALLRDYANFKTQRAGVFQLAFFGSDFPDPGSEEGQALDAIGEMDPNLPPYRDTNPETGTFEVDWDLWDADQERLLEIIDKKFSGFKDYYQNRTFLPEEFADVETQIIEARNTRDELRDISPVEGLSAAAWKEVQDFRADATEFRQQLRGRGIEMSVEEGLQRLASLQSKPAGFLRLALDAGRIQERQRNPKYLGFLLRHERELKPFFPELYQSFFMQDALFKATQAGIR